MEELRAELTRRDQEMLTMGAKMKALEDQQRDSQRHIRVLKDSLIAKEEHYNLLLADVEELRRNLDERNKLIERRSYQQLVSGPQSGPGNDVGSNRTAGSLEARNKRVDELQRRVHQLEDALVEREAQLERARIRLEHQQHGDGSDLAYLNHLEGTLNDREKQITLLRDQRDRAEQELNEERDSHERSIKEYQMRLNSAKFEMEKLQVSSGL